MRKHLLIALLMVGLVAMSSGIAMSYDGPDDGDIILRATGGRQSLAPRVVKLVRLNDSSPNGTDLASGDVVVYDTSSADGVTIGTTTSSADGAIAGIVIGNIQTGDCSTTTALGHEGRRNWGFIVVHGPALADVTASGVNGAVAGDPFVTSTDSSKVTMIEGTLTTQAGFGMVKAGAASGGFFYSTPAASDTQAKVFVRLE